MNYLFDENLPHRLARVIQVLTENSGYEVAHISKKFGRGAKDPDWLPRLGRQGDWAVITVDHKMLTRPAELQAYRTTGLVGFFLPVAVNQMNPFEATSYVAKWWPHIVAMAEGARRGDLFQIPHGGRPTVKKPVPRRRKAA